MKKGSLILQEAILPRIHWVRGCRAILDADLARKLDALEKKYDAQFKIFFDANTGQTHSR